MKQDTRIALPGGAFMTVVFSAPITFNAMVVYSSTQSSLSLIYSMLIVKLYGFCFGKTSVVMQNGVRATASTAINNVKRIIRLNVLLLEKFLLSNMPSFATMYAVFLATTSVSI